MRTLILSSLAALALATPALAQEAPATHRGNGTDIANNYRFLLEDQERMRNGRAAEAIAAAQRNVDAYTALRASQGRPVQPRR